jgi:hypothetical protein
MKKKYLELMNKALSAYSDDHIREYFDRAKTEGLTEHGFPRLTVNIGILIAHGYRQDLNLLFLEMMDFCCEQIPKVKAANDFSVREIVFCIFELKKQGVFLTDIERWVKDLTTIIPERCYDKFAKATDDVIGNWALFSALSEFARQKLTGCDSNAFIELQLENQLHRLDENGMYMDNVKHDTHQPIVYDLVPRYLFTLLLHFGYRGAHYERIDSILKDTALMTLKMQSITGEIAFGGRSNQFVHNESILAIIFEFEANRYAQTGDLETAGRFKAAISRAMEVTEYWLDSKPISHIKNHFPTETRYGCEKYAYFDKYMITTASHIFSAYMICDDDIPVADYDDTDSCFITSDHFHKLFMRSSGYFLEFDIEADPHYDASGLGRVHRYGAPSTICMSLPCPGNPNYAICTADRQRASLCPGKIIGGESVFTCDIDERIKVTKYSSNFATLEYPLDIRADYSINDNGIRISVRGDGNILYMLPAFAFDGEKETKITLENNILRIEYEGWTCKYTSNGIIKDLGTIARNRNGFYKLFYAEGQDSIEVYIAIINS